MRKPNDFTLTRRTANQPNTKSNKPTLISSDHTSSTLKWLTRQGFKPWVQIADKRSLLSSTVPEFANSSRLFDDLYWPLIWTLPGFPEAIMQSGTQHCKQTSLWHLTYCIRSINYRTGMRRTCLEEYYTYVIQAPRCVHYFIIICCTAVKNSDAITVSANLPLSSLE